MSESDIFYVVPVQCSACNSARRAWVVVTLTIHARRQSANLPPTVRAVVTRGMTAAFRARRAKHAKVRAPVQLSTLGTLLYDGPEAVGLFSEKNSKLASTFKLASKAVDFPRKQFERSVVKWVDADKTEACQMCKAPWKFMASRHHCRLCGTVMCDNCVADIALHDAEQVAALHRWGRAKLNLGFRKPPPVERKCKITDKIRVCRCCSKVVSAERAQLNAAGPFLKVRRRMLVDVATPVLECAESVGQQIDELEAAMRQLCDLVARQEEAGAAHRYDQLLQVRVEVDSKIGLLESVVQVLGKLPCRSASDDRRLHRSIVRRVEGLLAVVAVVLDLLAVVKPPSEPVEPRTAVAQLSPPPIPDDDMPVLKLELWQNERRWPGRGFMPDLFAKDPRPWSTADVPPSGTALSPSIDPEGALLAELEAMRGEGSATRDEYRPKGKGQQRWLSLWKVLQSAGEEDPDGWE